MRIFEFRLSVIRHLIFPALCILGSAMPALAKSPGQDALDEGAALYKQGSYAEARAAFRAAVEHDPGLVRGWENLGWSHYQLGETDDALRVWDMVLKVEPHNVDMLNETGKLYAQRGDLDAAIGNFKRSLGLHPEQPHIHLRIGDLYAQQNNVENAVNHYREATQDQDHGEKAALRLVALHQRTGHVDEAMKFLESLRRDNTLSPVLERTLAHLHATRADRLYRERSYEPAARHYRTAISLDPDQDQYRVNLGWALRGNNRLQQAIDVWREALQRRPERHELHRFIADAYYELGEPTAAQAWYRKAAETGADSPGVLLRLADAALEQKNRDEAVGWMKRLLARDNLESIWWLRAANAFERHDAIAHGIGFLTRYTEEKSNEAAHTALSRLYAARAAVAYRDDMLQPASEDFLAALKLDPHNSTVLRDLGWTYWRMERWDACEHIWKRYAAQEPGNAGPYNLLSQFYMRFKRYDEALQNARRGLAVAPDQPEQKLRLAKALYYTGQFSAAKSYAEGLAREYPGHLAIQYFWGDLLMRYHDFKRARVQWDGILRLENPPPDARFNFIRSVYETGDYDTAVALAEQFLHTYGPNGKILKFLADDAVVRADHNGVVRWTTALVEANPQKPARWLDLARQHFSAGEFEESSAVLRRAQAVHPDSLDIAVALADNERARGNVQQAYTQYASVARRHPGNRKAYTGMLYTLIESGRHQDALDLLRENRAGFLKDYEVSIEVARIVSAREDTPKSAELFEQIVPPSTSAAVIPVLLYHGLSEHPRSIDMYTALFEDQMAALRRAGYTPVSVAEFDRMRRGRQPFPSRPIVITFDDARRDSFVLGDPILRRHGMKATMFVPTARVLDDHPFFADWRTLREFHATGRWDLQNHGHDAHDPLPIDADGNSGSFLVNRAWLDEAGRMETVDEYTRRITRDHDESTRLLLENVPGLNVVAYAYPFSEAGQESIGNESAAYEINERAAREHFAYAFTQDGSGYNVVMTGDGTPRSLRRFTVPRDWDGARLLRHLAQQDPRNIARIAQGQSLLWQGRNVRARQVFQALDRDEPLVAEKSKYYLATTSHALGLPRDALTYFNDYQRIQPVLDGRVRKLEDKILWNNRARLDSGFGMRSDSNERQESWESLGATYPLRAPVDLWVNAGHMQLEEKNLPGSDIVQTGLGARWQLAGPLSVQGDVRVRQSDTVPDSTNTWLHTDYRTDTFKLNLRWSREDVDTVAARTAGLQMRTFNIRSTLWPTQRWTGIVQLSRNHYDDANRRYDGRVSALYQLTRTRPAWSAGAEFAYGDTDFASPDYYTPEQLRVGRLVLSYATSGTSTYPFDVTAGAGYARDDIHGTRPVANLEFTATQQWTGVFKTGISGTHHEAPGYRSSGMQAALYYRF